MFSLLRRFRVLVGLTGLAILLIPLVPGQLSHPYFLVRLDYVLLTSLILTTLAAAVDLKTYSTAPTTSTILLELVGLATAWSARLYLVARTYLTSSHLFYVGGFTRSPEMAVVGYAVTFLGTYLVVLCLTLHAVFKGPTIFTHSISLEELLSRLRSFTGLLGRYPIVLSFIIGFCVRLLPEIIWAVLFLISGRCVYGFRVAVFWGYALSLLTPFL